ncbi:MULTISPECIES: AraC family transcriptional regulator [Pseudomonas]|jgi:AraC-like DNA-binding protein|uniref:Helix-turn-helix transcriptional regulator n=2 Tax=Pseudomonas syringae TaxID=317 RepID=A0A8T8LZ31_PSESX|nr:MULTISPECIES: helix-turn-helix transcriptional regulator [Pseudomonas]ELQ13304.1 AraC family transcriptional regulator [Pseudomonas syringae BRIP39023]KPY35652.1 AraC family transcriptional regulator [Pseudomonas syringae pv. papulans]KTC09802.1 AraC family transcriptional regulator [Pseudomonas sp. ICMP 10191]KWS41161.1 AraC family transcriptional regulator [Pseudomonas syringae pv. papulans]MBC8882208.1 helix-turn-helix transcriptional regulator [Pseudomonas cerasi]
MPSNGQINQRQPTGERQIPALAGLPRPLYARAESLTAGSWTPPHRHDWVQFSYAISGVLGVHTAEGSFFAPPQWGVWVPAGLEHEVVTSMRAEMRSLYIRTADSGWAPQRCRVLEVTPLARELIKSFCLLPVDYPEQDSHEARLVQVLLDQLAQLPEVGFSLPLPRHPRLLGLCNELIEEPGRLITLHDWAARLGTSEKTLMRLFQRETGLSFRGWRQRARLLSSLSALEEGASVTHTALACGYDSTSAFIAAFKGLFGHTPGDLFK